MKAALKMEKMKEKRPLEKASCDPGKRLNPPNHLIFCDAAFKVNINAKDSDNLSKFTCKKCHYLAKDNATLKSHQLFHHQLVSVGQTTIMIAIWPKNILWKISCNTIKWRFFIDLFEDIKTLKQHEFFHGKKMGKIHSN